MEVPRDRPADEIKRLQRCINDLVSVLALPAMSSGGGPSQIARTFVDLLLGLLSLDLVYVRLSDSVDEEPVEMIRVGQSQKQMTPQAIGEVLDPWLREGPQGWPPLVREVFGDGALALAPLPLGLQGEIGVIVAGSQRTDFPTQTERLLLTVAANQAAIALQEARLLNEQKRVANELDRRVAQRTTELAAVNEELRRENAERRLAEERLRCEESELKRSEEALGNARSELARVAKVTALGALTASIAHEVNQPLAGILTNANTCLRMLATDPPNIDGARETARRTIRDGNRASDVIARLRALFMKKNLTTESVDLNEATREVIALSLSELQRDRVVLQLELPDDLPPVTGDRVQLQQVILNLLLNASEAMSAIDNRPRRLVLRTERDEGNRVRLTMQDGGVGIEPRNLERVFEPFYSTKSGGMGIGLSVSRSIIENHHGRLWAAANEGPGATFSFSIPRWPEAATAVQSPGVSWTPAVIDAAHGVRNT
jgi:signal transduction histidine kinase